MKPIDRSGIEWVRKSLDVNIVVENLYRSIDFMAFELVFFGLIVLAVIFIAMFYIARIIIARIIGWYEDKKQKSLPKGLKGLLALLIVIIIWISIDRIYMFLSNLNNPWPRREDPILSVFWRIGRGLWGPRGRLRKSLRPSLSRCPPLSIWGREPGSVRGLWRRLDWCRSRPPGWIFRGPVLSSPCPFSFNIPYMLWWAWACSFLPYSRSKP